MITKILTTVKASNLIEDDWRALMEYRGKSTDEKPVENVNNGDVFYEMDTKKVYLFDEETSTWLEQ